MAVAPDPNYSLRDALSRYAPGSMPTREIDDGLYAAYAANGFQPLTEAQVVAVVTESTGSPPPALPLGLPRFADSNPSPLDGWSLDAEAA